MMRFGFLFSGFVWAVILWGQRPDMLQQLIDPDPPAPSAVEAGIEGSIDFDILGTTIINQDPPPVYKPELAALDGKRVKIIGFMAPYESLEDLTTFMLMRINVGCQFCAPPSIFDVMLVHQRKKKAKYEEGMILVEGTLHLWAEESDQNGHKAGYLYVLDDATVERYKG